MIHELIDPKKKTNKATASRQIRTLLDNRPVSDHLPFYPSDNENKEVDSSTTFIPPWLRNSLGLSQRHNQSHLAAGHSDQKSTKIIHRFKESNQNEYDTLKTNEEDDCCKNVQNQFESHCPQDENAPESTTQERIETDEVLHREETMHWQVMSKESDTDSSLPNTDRRDFEKEEQKMKNSEMMTLAEIDKIRDEEKKKLRYFRQKNRLRRRGEQKAFEHSKGDAECMVDVKGKDTMESCSKKIMRTVTSDIRQFETKFLLLQKSHGGKIPRLSQQELRLLQDIKEQVGSIGDFEALLDQEGETHSKDLVKTTNFLTHDDGDKKIDDSVLQKYNDDIKAEADKDSLLSTDDEHDIKRFSEFLSKNKNAEEKRKCLEEVRNYFERKRKTRLSKRHYLENLRSKLSPEIERKEEHKDKLKCRELTMILPNRGKRSKFALCDEEVVERAVDETLQKFMELYHFHVSPTVMGNMKKNILQAMQSDSMDSSGSKMNLERKKSAGKKLRNDLFSTTKQSPRREVQCSYPRRVDISETPNNEMVVHKELKKKTFNTLMASSSEQLLNQSKETDVVDNERLKRLNKEFEIFLRSVQGHLDVSSLKIQSIILEKEETNPSKHVQFVYNFSKKSLEMEKPSTTLREMQGPMTLKEMGVQANLKKEPTKKNVRVQVVDYKDKSDKDLQTDVKTYATEGSQTEGGHVTVRELKELKSFDINPGLYRMVKSKEAGKFYLYPEQLESSKAQSFAKSDTSMLKERQITEKELILPQKTSKERQVNQREKVKVKLKKTKKVLCSNSHLKTGIGKRNREIKRKPLDLKKNNVANNGSSNNGSSINCLYFRDIGGNASETLPSERDPPSKAESVPETSENLGVGDMKEEHLGCVWLWNGEKISPGCDLKTHVENLLKEKLKEMTDIDILQKTSLQKNLAIHATETKTLPKNVFPKVLNLSKAEPDPLPGVEEPQKISEKKKSNPVFCYSNYNNLTAEKDPPLQFTNDNDVAEPIEKSDVKKTEETKELKSSSVSQEKLVRNVGTQNSQQRFLSINLAKTRTHSKSTVAVSKKKEGKRTSLVKPVTRKFVNFKKAEGIIRAVEEIKKIQMELESVRKNDSKDSDSILDTSSSSYGSKNENEDTVSLVLGLCDGRSKTEETSGCTVKSRIRKMMDLMNHEVQTSSVVDFEDANSEESQNAGQLSENHRHVELIEDFLCKVSQKERETLWNDIREFIKTKIGRDINDDGAKEVCIEIEQDLPKNEHGVMKQGVFAKGHYVKNEGEVEVEIDLTLEDFEKILRQRQKRIRKQRLYRKRYKRFISSSSIQSDFTKEEMRKYQKYLNRVATLGEGFVTENPTGSLKKNKGN